MKLATMQVITTTTTTINFTVQYFEDEEGGMGTGQYGGTVTTIEAALELQQRAVRDRSGHDWVIVGEVVQQTESKRVDAT